jgi:hypothetical protein
MSKLRKGEQKVRSLEILLRFLSRLPGLGFLDAYATQMRIAAEKVDNARNKVAAQKDDIEDAKDAWEEFKG